MKILFAGCGDIGTRTASRLAADFDCFGFKRNPQTLPEFISPLVGSMTDLDRLVEVLNQDFDVLVATLTPDGFNPEAYRRAYVDSAKTLVAKDQFGQVTATLHKWQHGLDGQTRESFY
mgnify:CR=1 FL=1